MRTWVLRCLPVLGLLAVFGAYLVAGDAVRSWLAAAAEPNLKVVKLKAVTAGPPPCAAPADLTGVADKLGALGRQIGETDARLAMKLDQLLAKVDGAATELQAVKATMPPWKAASGAMPKVPPFETAVRKSHAKPRKAHKTTPGAAPNR